MVKTNDPDNQKFYLRISGQVKQIVKVVPRTLSLNGTPGKTITSVVTIEPMHNEQLNILDMKLKFNKEVKAELIKPKDGEKIWKVKVSCYSDQVADIYDFITLKTDNPLKPRLKIRVYAIFDKADTP